PEGAFQPGVWDITPLWAVLLVISGFVAAIAGGYAARRIDKDMRGAYILLGISVVLGIFFAIPVITGSGIQPLSTRPDELPMMDAMANGRQPIWVALLNPVIGAIGVLFGARLYHPKEA
ncbi:MAG: hypothetical protein KDD65_10500, partial [Bacteroidetes bacterium]|nr:hypothetical protein [Bacteroidota bacterium]